MLTDNQVLEIRAAGKTLSLRQLADRYGVSHIAIRNILIGRRLTKAERTHLRFWAKVQTGATHECWIWQGATNSEGYGQFRLDGPLIGAHCAVLNLTGVSTTNKIVRHTCDIPLCVNPNHLRLGTILDNINDRDTRGRTAVGERHGRSKLTIQQVRTIRRVKKPVSILAQQYEVDPKTIRNILTRKTWRYT